MSALLRKIAHLQVWVALLGLAPWAWAEETEAPPWFEVTQWAVHTPPAKAIPGLTFSARQEAYHLQQNPDDTAALGKLSVLQFTLGRYEDAAESFYQLLDRQPTYPFAFAQYMQALYLSGDPDTVRFLLKKNVGKHAAPLPTEMLSAQLDFEVLAYPQARAHLEQALIHLEAQKDKMADRNHARLKKIVVLNLIHLSHLLKDKEGPARYLKMMPEFSPSK